MTDQSLLDAMEQYRAGLETGVAILRQLHDVAARQHEGTTQRDFPRLAAESDERDRLTRALVAIERRILLHHIARTGVPLDAEARADALVTLFWPGTPLHDGGAILRGDRIVAARCIFPLSERRELSSQMGTRHRAGLGLSEECDAVVVVVSEETGHVTVMSGGAMRTVEPAELGAHLHELLGPPESAPPPGPRLGDAAAAAAEERTP